MIACSYDGNDFGGCVDDVDGVVILSILLSGQNENEDSFPIEKRIWEKIIHWYKDK